MNYELQPLTGELLRELPAFERAAALRKYHAWLEETRKREKQDAIRAKIRKDNWVFKKKKLLFKYNFSNSYGCAVYTLVISKNGLLDNILGFMPYTEIGGE